MDLPTWAVLAIAFAVAYFISVGASALFIVVYLIQLFILIRLQPRRWGGYVYVIQDVEISKLYKIGRTKEPAVRTKTFNVKLPFATEVICMIPCRDDVAAEKMLHERFAHKRVRGEWFRLNNDQLAYLRSLRSL